MSNPDLGVDSTQVPNDFLGDLLAVTKEIRDLLRQKSDQEHRAAHQFDEASHQSDKPPSPAADAITQGYLNTDSAIVEVVVDRNHIGSNAYTDDWDEMIARYRARCAKHESECEKMQVELGCFIAHLGFVGGNQRIIENAESLRTGLLDPVQCVEKVFDVTPDERENAMDKVESSFFRYHAFVHGFALSPHQEDAIYPHKVEQWRSCTENGWSKIYDLVRDGSFVKCLEFIHDDFFSELEMAMGGVVEALSTFEKKAASEWLATQKIQDFKKWSEKYISCAFSPLEATGGSSASPYPVTIMRLKEKLPHHQSVCDKMSTELDHLIQYYDDVGGEKEFIEAAKLVQSYLLGFAKHLKTVVSTTSDVILSAMNSVLSCLGRLYLAVDIFKGSLYQQTRTFYFRKVEKWVDCLWNGLHVVYSYMHREKLDECLNYITINLFSELEVVMIGPDTMPIGTKRPSERLPGTTSGNIAEELKMFVNEYLPKLRVEETERDTTRYANLTTISTFVSSMTATTLQFTYAGTPSVPSDNMRGVVNFFWFLSLIFSVSSAVSSLLGFTWRKSSIYNSRDPPMLIRMWLEKAPVLFLVIAAVAFIIGLNLFAYLSLQPRYVSFATNIFTGLHVVFLLVVTAWFMYQLKYESIWAVWVRKVWKPIKTTAEWIVKGIWQMVNRPYEKYEQNKLHIQRNIYWAFGIDNRIARLNADIDWRRDWSDPYLFSKLIRSIAYPIKRCCLVTNKALSDLSRSVRKHICIPSHAENPVGDVEMGENVRREEAKAPEETSPESQAKNELRKSLQTVFSDANSSGKLLFAYGD